VAECRQVRITRILLFDLRLAVRLRRNELVDVRVMIASNSVSVPREFPEFKLINTTELWPMKVCVGLTIFSQAM